MADELTPAARAALINCGTGLPGASLPQGTPAAVRAELWGNKLITVRGNLTRTGAIVRARTLDWALAEMEDGL